jgi:hypothetical protein
VEEGGVLAVRPVLSEQHNRLLRPVFRRCSG